MFHEVENHITRSKMSNREMVKKMTKEEAVKIMLETINSNNLTLGLQAGLDENALRSQIEQSQQSLNFMLSDVYDKLKENGVIA
jgi:hypothetical protein